MSEESVTMRQMPRYKCHKEVWALKIQEIQLAAYCERYSVGAAFLVPADEGYHPVRVSHEYMLKHKPQVGGYYVQYKDGYESYSPAKAFEEGYTALS